MTSDVTDTSFVASWTPAPGNVRAYRVRWKSLFSQEQGDKAVPGDVSSTELSHLSPETLYQVSVEADYGFTRSDAVTAQETTDGESILSDSWSLHHRAFLTFLCIFLCVDSDPEVP